MGVGDHAAHDAAIIVFGIVNVRFDIGLSGKIGMPIKFGLESALMQKLAVMHSP